MHNYESELEVSFDVVLDEADRLYEGQGRLKRTYERLAKRLDKLNVPYSLAGGYALILHGVRRFTKDIDLLVSNEGLAKLHEGLIGRGYVQASPGSRNLRDAETGVRIEFVVTGEFPNRVAVNVKSQLAPSELLYLLDCRRFSSPPHGWLIGTESRIFRNSAPSGRDCAGFHSWQPVSSHADASSAV